MPIVSRRSLLGSALLAPMLPAVGVARSADKYDGHVVIIVRMMGGNDGLNTVVPIRDDRYYRARPTIAIPKHETLALPGRDVGLHPSLSGFHDLMENGCAGIVQAVGYPTPSRSHVRATEIWEKAALGETPPAAGWLGRYLESDCRCEQSALNGLQLGATSGGAIASESARVGSLLHPTIVEPLSASRRIDTAPLGKPGSMDASASALARAHAALIETSTLTRRARRGSGSRYDYPQTEFGQALKYAANLIETESPTRIYALSIGSFENDAPSFDTHVDQLPKHRLLYSELAEGVRALAKHLKATGDFSRTLLLTYSDFGRQLPENTTRGTEHGDAGVMFYAGGRVVPGLRGAAPDLARVTQGGLDYSVDFRSIFADVRANWLRAGPDSYLTAPAFPIVTPT